MPTPPVPAKSNGPAANREAEHRAEDATARRADSPAQDALPPASPAGRGDAQPQPDAEPLAAPLSDRAVDADLLIDVPQLTVEELALELDASLLLNHVKLDAKGLEAKLYMKANADRIVALTRKGSQRNETESENRRRGSDALRVRTGLRELLGATREAYRDLSDSDVQEQLRDVHASAREAYEHVTSSDEPAREEDDGGHGGSARTARHAVTQGVKAAGLTAAGLAGGALLESRTGMSSRTLPIPRRRSRMQAVRDKIGKRLP